MEVNRQITTDVCVIGGGPAGSTIAHRLASFGYEVCLVESAMFPGPHIGASLLPGILPLLECIEARDCVERAGFPRRERTIVWWTETIPAIRDEQNAAGFHVERGKFDQLLLQNAKRNGVYVIQPARARSPVRITGGKWKIHLRREDSEHEVISKIVVDASGGQKLFSGRRLRSSEPLLALFAHWKCVDAQKTAAIVEAGENEWFWYAPLDDEKAIAAVFIDPKRLSETDCSGIDSLYHQLIGRFKLFPIYHPKASTGKVTACDASSRYSENPVENDFVRIGDANLSLDPLSSQGVQLAVASGLQAAYVVNTLLKCPHNASAAIEFYRARQQEKMLQHAAKTASFYREKAAVCSSPFWHRRAGSGDTPVAPVFNQDGFSNDCKILISDNVKVINTPIIKEDIIISAPALHYDSAERPVAFVGGVEIVNLVNRIIDGQSIQAVVDNWSQSLPIELSYKIMSWLWSRKIVAPALE